MFALPAHYCNKSSANEAKVVTPDGEVDLDPGAILLPLGRQGRRLARTQEFGPGEVWMKPMAGGSAAAAFFNLNERDGRLLSVSWEGLGLEPSQPCTVRHAWSGETVEGVVGSHTVRVDSHDAELIVVTPEF